MVTENHNIRAIFMRYLLRRRCGHDADDVKFVVDDGVEMVTILISIRDDSMGVVAIAIGGVNLHPGSQGPGPRRFRKFRRRRGSWRGTAPHEIARIQEHACLHCRNRLPAIAWFKVNSNTLLRCPGCSANRLPAGAEHTSVVRVHFFLSEARQSTDVRYLQSKRVPSRTWSSTFPTPRGHPNLFY